MYGWMNEKILRAFGKMKHNLNFVSIVFMMEIST